MQSIRSFLRNARLRAEPSALPAAALSLLLVATTAHGAPFSYNEAVSGDLSSSSLSPTFTGDIGANIVMGTTSAVDPDFFRFTVPNEALLVSYVLTYTNNVAGNGGLPGSWVYNQNFGGPPGAVITSLSPSGTTTIPVYLSGPLTVAQNGFASLPSGSVVDYVITINVAVPEPSTAALLAGGLFGLAACRRRRAGSSASSPAWPKPRVVRETRC